MATLLQIRFNLPIRTLAQLLPKGPDNPKKHRQRKPSNAAGSKLTMSRAAPMFDPMMPVGPRFNHPETYNPALPGPADSTQPFLWGTRFEDRGRPAIGRMSKPTLRTNRPPRQICKNQDVRGKQATFSRFGGPRGKVPHWGGGGRTYAHVLAFSGVCYLKMQDYIFAETCQNV